MQEEEKQPIVEDGKTALGKQGKPTGPSKEEIAARVKAAGLTGDEPRLDEELTDEETPE